MTNLLNAQCFVSLWSSILQENSQARSGYERMLFFARGSVVKFCPRVLREGVFYVSASVSVRASPVPSVVRGIFVKLLPA